MYDVVIIGAGVTGGFVARELLRYKVKVALLEKNNDICSEVTKANTAIVHSGYSPKPGS
ncbi:MAG: FAD-dependent oxidoreductase, partial [Dethiobacteria bacterium]